jgi:hypothetical protein
MAISAPPITLTSIQNEFDASSLSNAASVAGLSLPVGMLDFEGLSSSVDIVSNLGLFSAFDWSGPLFGPIDSQATSIFVEPPVMAINFNAPGFQFIPVGAQINSVRFEVFTGACCRLNITRLVSPIPRIFLNDSGTTNFLDSNQSFFFAGNNFQFAQILSAVDLGSFNVIFNSSRTGTFSEKFISAWNSAELSFGISGPNFTGETLTKRFEETDVFRVWSSVMRINYSLP